MGPGYDIENVTCIAESHNGKNLLFENKECDEFKNADNGDYGTCWIPKSQITDDSEVYAKGDEGTLIVTEWLAKERGWL